MVDCGDGAPDAALTQRRQTFGRPTKYTPELAARLIDEVQSGLTLRQVCDNDWAPSHQAVTRWLSQQEDFRVAWTRAREVGAHQMAEQTISIADDAVPDKYGKVEHDKLKIVARQWLVSKLNKQYAERQIVQHEDGQAADLTQLSAAGLADLLTAVTAHVKRQGAIDTTAESVAPSAGLPRLTDQPAQDVMVESVAGRTKTAASPDK